MRDYNQLTPTWQPKRMKTGRWVVRLDGQTTTFRPVPVETLPKNKNDFSSCPQAAFDLVDTYKLAQKTGGVAISAEPKTVAAAIEVYCKWMEQRRDEDESVTPKWCRDTCRNARAWLNYDHKNKPFGKIKVAELFAADVEAVFKQMKAEGDKFKTSENKIQALRSALSRAAALKWIEEENNPARRVKNERPIHRTTEAQAEADNAIEQFSVADIDAICKAALSFDRPLYKQDKNTPDGRYILRQVAWCDGLAVVFAIRTGLRWGELAAIKWKFIDFQNNCIEVRTAVREDKDGKNTVGVTKTKQSKRSVFLTPSLKKLLSAWKLRSPFSGDEDRVFCTREGTIQNSSTNLRERVLYEACKQVEVAAPTWHGLRHLFASLLVAMFKPTEKKPDDDATWAEIARLMGHSSPKETWNTYVHWLQDAKQNADIGARLDALLEAAG